MKTAKELFAEADALRSRADAKAQEASSARQTELEATPLFDRLVFAADARCDCGAGLAYDPATPEPPFKMPSSWKCSDIILHSTYDAERKAKVEAAVHTRPLPFAFYEIKSEGQPSANGRTTRPEREEA